MATRTSAVKLPPVRVTGRNGSFKRARLENGTRLFLGVPSESRQPDDPIPFLSFDRPIHVLECDTVWALYVSTAKYSVNGISLHQTEREALESLVNYLRSGYDDDPRYNPKKLLAMSDGALYERLRALGDRQGTEWHIENVQLPGKEKA